jgi:multiple sugar transport system substrate-binding protein
LWLASDGACCPKTIRSGKPPNYYFRKIFKEGEMSRKQLTRREFLSLSTTVGAGAVLAASGVAGALAVTQAAPAAALATGLTTAANAVDLQFVWWGGQQRSDVTTQIIKMFETKHPNVKFSFEPLGFDESWTNMATQAAGGGLLDAMQHGSPSPVKWTTNGFLQSFVASGVTASKNVPEVLQTLGMIDGKIYGVRAGTNATSFVVDMDAFEEAGIKVPANTWTWIDFENTVEEMHGKLGIWGFGVFLHHNDLWREPLALVSLGDCSCLSCRTKVANLMKSGRGPTPLALLST